MNVAILLSKLAGGGLEKYGWKIAEAFANKGHSVTILLSAPSKTKLSHPNIHFVVVGRSPRRGFLKLLLYDFQCKRWLKKHPHQIVFGMERTTDQTHYRAGNGTHKQFLHSRTGAEGILKRISFFINPLHRTILNLEKRNFENKNLKILFTNSQMVKQEILKNYTVTEEKIQVVHNGVEWKNMQTDFDQWENQREKELSKRSLNRDHHQFLFIGHGYQRKGLEQALKGLALIDKHNHPFELSVVGKDKNIKIFKQLAEQLGLEKQVHFFGEQKNIIPFYQIADSLLLPTKYDPFANVTVEALAMGLFVVTSKFNGGHEILNDSSGAIIEELSAPKSVATALKSALKRKKTAMSSLAIRNQFSHLDFSHQLNKIVTKTVETTNAL